MSSDTRLNAESLNQTPRAAQLSDARRSHALRLCDGLPASAGARTPAFGVHAQLPQFLPQRVSRSPSASSIARHQTPSPGSRACLSQLRRLLDSSDAREQGDILRGTTELPMDASRGAKRGGNADVIGILLGNKRRPAAGADGIASTNGASVLLLHDVHLHKRVRVETYLAACVDGGEVAGADGRSIGGTCGIPRTSVAGNLRCHGTDPVGERCDGFTRHRVQRDGIRVGGSERFDECCVRGLVAILSERQLLQRDEDIAQQHTGVHVYLPIVGSCGGDAWVLRGVQADFAPVSDTVSGFVRAGGWDWGVCVLGDSDGVREYAVVCGGCE